MRGTSFLHFVKYFFYFDSAQTQTSPAEMALIKKYACQRKYAVEIGVYEAVNTVSIAKAISNEAIFFAIDPFFKSKFGICYHKWITYLNLFRNRVLKKVKIVEAFSYDVAKDIDDKIDFIFVDGDHSRVGIQKDWVLFSDKIISGGYILLHDTAVPEFDPNRAFLESVPFFIETISKDQRFRTVEFVDSLNVLQKI